MLISIIPPARPTYNSESPKRIMTHFVTPEPLNMVIERCVKRIRPPVARVLFPNDDEIEDPPPLVRSEVAVVPWDEEEDFPDPPVGASTCR